MSAISTQTLFLSETSFLPTDPRLCSRKSTHMNPSTDPTCLFNLDGQVAVVTGGGTGTHPVNHVSWPHSRLPVQGIGLMIATSLEHNGATVYIVGRRLDVLQKAAFENNVRPSSSSRSLAPE